jgi:hypothetical protein
MEKILFSLLIIIIFIIYFTSINSKKNEVESFSYYQNGLNIALLCRKADNLDQNCVRNMCSDPQTGDIDHNCVTNMCREPKTSRINHDCLIKMNVI